MASSLMVFPFAVLIVRVARWVAEREVEVAVCVVRVAERRCIWAVGWLMWVGFAAESSKYLRLWDP